MSVIEKFNTATVTFKNVIYFFIIIIMIVLFYAKVKDHLNDKQLHSDSFNNDWQNRVIDLEHNKFTEDWRIKIIKIDNKLEALSKRVEEKDKQLSEDIKDIRYTLKSVFDVKVSTKAKSIK